MSFLPDQYRAVVTAGRPESVTDTSTAGVPIGSGPRVTICNCASRPTIPVSYGSLTPSAAASLPIPYGLPPDDSWSAFA
jgi:hypothetical protein